MPKLLILGLVLILAVFKLGCSGGGGGGGGAGEALEQGGDGLKSIQEAEPLNLDEVQARANVDCSPTKKGYLKIHPVSLSNVSSIQPLGSTNSKGHIFPTQHIYYRTYTVNGQSQIKLNFNSKDVYSAGDWVVSMISWKKDGASNDFTVQFRSCKQLKFYYNHLSGLNGVLSNVDPSKDIPNRHCIGDEECFIRFPDGLPVMAGDVIGQVFRDGQPALDFGAKDERGSQQGLASPERFNVMNFYDELYDSYLSKFNDITYDEAKGFVQDSAPEIGFAECPLDYYQDPQMAAVIESKFQSYDHKLSTVKKHPKCFFVRQDLPGKGQGRWFSSEALSAETSLDESKNVGLNLDHLKDDSFYFTIGANSKMKQMPSFNNNPVGEITFDAVKDGNINVAFNAVSVGPVFCYDNLKVFGHENDKLVGDMILLRLVDDSTLKMEYRKGGGLCNPNSNLADPNSTLYYR